MQNVKIKELENKANELFGERSTISIAEAKFANKGYIVRIKMQGMPFEISAMQGTLEDAERVALEEFEKHATDEIKNSLFPTQPIEQYKSVKLTDSQFERLFKHEEFIGKEYIEELKEKTIAKLCQLDDGKYECVIESPYMCLHARGTSGSQDLSILSATMRAYDVFRASTIYVGNNPWEK